MKLNAVMIIPTGLGCSIGGHAGDATPAARLLGAVCDKLFLHPNVVNASDINEMPANALYVEGSTLDRFLAGQLVLRLPRRGNHVLVVVNDLEPSIVNGVAAACTTLGMTAELLKLTVPLRMVAEFTAEGFATGVVTGVDELIMDVQRVPHDALAVVTPIEVSPDVALLYCKEGGVNPWGGVEARASAMIATHHPKPVAHAPFFPKDDPLNAIDEVCDPRQAAEMVSVAYLFCIMKGLCQAPRPELSTTEHPGTYSFRDVDALVSPWGCWGLPHEACEMHGIPIIMVRENECLNAVAPSQPHMLVANYLEAAGMLAAMGAGISPVAVRR